MVSPFSSCLSLVTYRISNKVSMHFIFEKKETCSLPHIHSSLMYTIKEVMFRATLGNVLYVLASNLIQFVENSFGPSLTTFLIKEENWFLLNVSALRNG